MPPRAKKPSSPPSSTRRSTRQTKRNSGNDEQESDIENPPTPSPAMRQLTQQTQPPWQQQSYQYPPYGMQQQPAMQQQHPQTIYPQQYAPPPFGYQQHPFQSHLTYQPGPNAPLPMQSPQQQSSATVSANDDSVPCDMQFAAPGHVMYRDIVTFMGSKENRRRALNHAYQIIYGGKGEQAAEPCGPCVKKGAVCMVYKSGVSSDVGRSCAMCRMDGGTCKPPTAAAKTKAPTSTRKRRAMDTGTPEEGSPTGTPSRALFEGSASASAQATRSELISLRSMMSDIKFKLEKNAHIEQEERDAIHERQDSLDSKLVDIKGLLQDLSSSLASGHSRQRSSHNADRIIEAVNSKLERVEMRFDSLERSVSQSPLMRSDSTFSGLSINAPGRNQRPPNPPFNFQRAQEVAQRSPQRAQEVAQTYPDDDPQDTAQSRADDSVDPKLTAKELAETRDNIMFGDRPTEEEQEE